MSTLSVETIKSLAASTPPAVQDSAGTEIGTFCRAWVNFNGTFASSPFTIANGGIRAAFNVTSVSDNGVGDYTINFSNAMPDANYAVVATREMVTGATNPGTGTKAGTMLTTSATIFNIGGSSSVAQDNTQICVSVFR